MQSEQLNSSRGSKINQDFCDIIIEYYRIFLSVELKKVYKLGYRFKRNKKGIKKKVKARFRFLEGKKNNKIIIIRALNKKYAVYNDNVPLEAFKDADIKIVMSASWLSKKTNRRCLDNDISVDVSCMQYIIEYRKNVDSQSYMKANRSFRHEYAFERGLELKDIEHLNMPYYRLPPQITNDKNRLFLRWNRNLNRGWKDRTRGHKQPSIYSILNEASGYIGDVKGIPTYYWNKDDYKLKTLYFSSNDPPR